MLVLVVEDDPEIARAVTLEHERSGHEAHCAGDGETGLHLALNTQYAGAVVDLMLPRMDGLTLLDRLRAHGVKAPVIVLSASD